MASSVLQRLAGQIGRPAQSIDALAELPEPVIEALCEAVDHAEVRQRAALNDAWRQALPRPIRALALAWLRRPERGRPGQDGPAQERLQSSMNQRVSQAADDDDSTGASR